MVRVVMVRGHGSCPCRYGSCPHEPFIYIKKEVILLR